MKSTSKIIRLTSNRQLCRLFYRVYFALFRIDLRLNNIKSSRNRVFDSYGEIDTLGDQSDQGRFTSSYGNELYHEYRIFGRLFLADDCGDEAVYFQ